MTISKPEPENTAAQRQMQQQHEDEMHLRATRVSRRADIAAVRLHKSRGMSRKRLIAIYGRDVVDLALTT